jgi:uncharacterized protein (TIGR03000 family)
MYSLVLMTALTSAPAFGSEPEAPIIVSDMGCLGCTGYSGCAGCTGCSGCHGCSGSCHGGLLLHRFVGLFGHRHSCLGCSGMSCSGCLGSVVMGPETWMSSNPKAGQFGWVGASCLGTFSSASGCHGGCSGLVSYWGQPSGLPLYTLYALPWSASIAEKQVANNVPTIPQSTLPEIKRSEHKEASPSTATVRVKLPAGAVLYVDGVLTKQSGTERSFITPPLAHGDRYCYDIRAEMLAHGKLEVEERQIIVVSGATVVESFQRLLSIADRVGDPLATK